MEKITDLRREILEKQLKKNICEDIAEISLNFKKNHFDVYEEAVKKIADSIIRPILEGHTEKRIKIKASKDSLRKITSVAANEARLKMARARFLKAAAKVNANGYIRVSIDCNLSTSKKELIDVVVGEKNFARKNRPSKVLLSRIPSFEIAIKDRNGETVTFLTKLMKLGKKLRNAWAIRGLDYYNAADAASMMAEVYLINEVCRYMESNEERRNFVILDRLSGYRQLIREEYKENILKMVEEFNLTKEDYKFTDKEDAPKHICSWFDATLDKFEDMFAYGRNGKLVFGYPHGPKTDMIAHYLKSMLKESQDIITDVKMKRNLASDYAKSYETKKNIPEKVQEKMKNNQFLKCFGYVELDELSDLSLISRIEKDFEDLYDFLNMSPMKDHSLRFRRLGHHKAAGMYFPTMKALCVDLEGPGSMVHEIMHMMDFTTIKNSALSDLYNFRSVINCYIRFVEGAVEKLPEDNYIRKEFFSSNKYNKDYYFQNTEIFARCGEIYVNKILGYDSSLIKDLGGIYYPFDDEQLLNLIKGYYARIFGEVGINVKKPENVAGTSSSPAEKKISSKSIELVETSSGQYAFF